MSVLTSAGDMSTALGPKAGQQAAVSGTEQEGRVAAAAVIPPAVTSAQPTMEATPAVATVEDQSRASLGAALGKVLKNAQLFVGRTATFVEEILAKLAQAMTDTYKAMFSQVYKQSALGAVFELVNQTFKLEAVRLLLLGEVVPTDMKLAADKEKEFKDAQQIMRDKNGRITLAVDKNGDRHEFVYDESGETEVVTGSKGQIRTRHLDPSGRLLSESQDGRTVTYQYLLDVQGQVTQTETEEHTANGVAKYIYDAQGKLQTQIANGKRNDFKTTGAGADEKLTATTTNEKDGKFIEQRTYKAGRLETVKSADGTLTTYSDTTDGTGKVVETVVTSVDQDQQKTTLKYDAEGRLVSKNDQPVSQEAAIAEQALTSELDKQLTDPRLDTKQLQLQQMQAPK